MVLVLYEFSMKAILGQYMPLRVPREGHSNVNVPDELLDRVEKVVEESEGGYTSKAEFVRAAIRERLKRYEREAPEEDETPG